MQRRTSLGGIADDGNKLAAGGGAQAQSEIALVPRLCMRDVGRQQQNAQNH